MRIPTVLAGLAVLVIAAPVRARDDDSRTPAVLLLTETRGFVPDVLLARSPDGGESSASGDERSLVHRTVVELGRGEAPFRVVHSDRAAECLRRDVLARYRGIVLYTSGNLEVSEENVDALVDWVRSGGGLVGVHAAVATFARFPAFAEMLGAKLAEQPWHERVGVTLHDSYHPATLPVRPYWKIKDRILRFRDFQTKEVRVLLSMDMTSVASAVRVPHHVPVSWVRGYSQGRVFYTSLGYRSDVWRDATYRAHLRGGILWAIGARAGSDEPNPRVSAALEELARRAAQPRTAARTSATPRPR